MAISILSRILDRPVEALTLAREHARSWWLPALLVVATGLALAWCVAPYEAARQAEQTEALLSRLPAEQRDLALEQQMPATTGPVMILIGVGLGALVAALGWAVRAGVLHLGAVALGGESQWPGTYAAVVWSMTPLAVRNLVQMGSVIMRGQAIAHQGLAFLVATADPWADAARFTYQFLGNIDPFALWHLALFIIAAKVAVRISWAKAAITALVIWVAITTLRILPALISARLMASLFA